MRLSAQAKGDMQPQTAVGSVGQAAASAEAEHHVAVPFSASNSKLAMWLFLASEVMFFTVLFGAYLIARFAHPEEHSLLNVPVTSLNTFLLLTSSFTVVRALAAIQRGDVVRFQRSLALTGLLGTVFVGIMFFEYMELSHHGLTITSDPFGFAFFTLTGFHGMHVIIGLIWLMVLFNRSLNGGFTRTRHFGVEFWGLYWHFVDVVWIFIFTVVYLL
jgi:heme/copper-type cytochrome/quinol oxidase subunit 3